MCTRLFASTRAGRQVDTLEHRSWILHLRSAKAIQQKDRDTCWVPVLKIRDFFSSSHLRKECQGEVGGCKSLSKP